MGPSGKDEIENGHDIQEEGGGQWIAEAAHEERAIHILLNRYPKSFEDVATCPIKIRRRKNVGNHRIIGIRSHRTRE